MNTTIKFAQSPSCYIVYFNFVVKICLDDLYLLYVDPTFTFHGEEFIPLSPWQMTHLW